MTSGDVAVYFSQEERRLLNVTQRHLYYDCFLTSSPSVLTTFCLSYRKFHPQSWTTRAAFFPGSLWLVLELGQVHLPTSL